MTPAAPGPVTHGPYSLLVSFGTSKGMVIQRQDPGRKRTVAFVDTLAEWDRFAAALECGVDEVAAVHAIDAPGDDTAGQEASS